MHMKIKQKVTHSDLIFSAVYWLFSVILTEIIYSAVDWLFLVAWTKIIYSAVDWLFSVAWAEIQSFCNGKEKLQSLVPLF